MISHIDIAGIGMGVDDKIKKYVRRKVGKLSKFLSKRDREVVRAEVKLHQASSHKLGNKYECEITIHGAGELFQAKEATLNIFAAVDIAEQKIKNQLLRHKQAHQKSGIIKRLKARFSKQK